jgi:hypothetical protein
MGEYSRAGQSEAKTRDLGDDVPERDNTLTAEEREAIAYYIGTGGPAKVDATLRGLLDRTQDGANRQQMRSS